MQLDEVENVHFVTTITQEQKKFKKIILISSYCSEWIKIRLTLVSTTGLRPPAAPLTEPLVDKVILRERGRSLSNCTDSISRASRDIGPVASDL